MPFSQKVKNFKTTWKQTLNKVRIKQGEVAERFKAELC